MIATKKLISVLFALLIAVTGTVITFAPESHGTEFTLKVVHTNDINARVQADEWNKVIGMSKLKTIIDDNTKDCDINFVLDSGDAFYGQSVATLVNGESVAKLMGACGYDAITVGNHDWNYGKDRLKELVNIVDKNNKKQFRMLAGNVRTKNGSRFFKDEYLIKSVEKEGLEFKIGVFGVIDPLLYKDTAPSNVKGLEFTDMKEYAEKSVEKLKEDGCQFIIGLIHSDNAISLASSLEGVNLWIAGQDGMDINQTVFTPEGNKTFVMKNDIFLNEVGVLEFKCTFDGRGNISELNHTVTRIDYDKSKKIEEDEKVASILEKINSDNSKIEDGVVGKSPAYLIREWEDIRIAEMPIGRAITDAYLLETGADIAFETVGSIRDSILYGDVTYEDIHDVLPYGYYLVTKELTGAEILSILEMSTEILRKNLIADASGSESAWPSNSGSFLQVGGLTARYEPTADYGSRVYAVRVNGAPIKGEQKYIVAMNSNMASSYVFANIAQKDTANEFGSCEEAFANYFKQSESKILKSISTVRMIKGTGEEDEEKLITQQLPNGTEIIATADEALREEPTTAPNANNNAGQNNTAPNANNNAGQNNTAPNANNNAGQNTSKPNAGLSGGKKEPTPSVPTGSNSDVTPALLSLMVMSAVFVVLQRRRKETL